MSLQDFLWSHSIETQALSLNPDAALQSAIFADGLTPVGTEIWVDYGDDTYAYMAAESLSEADLRRVYYAKVPEWDNILIVEGGDESIDMGAYFTPTDRKKSPVFILSNNWSGGSERVQLQMEGDHSFVVKNAQYEERFVGSDFIDMVVDTSPGGGKYYTIKDGHWLPRWWRVGDMFNRVETVTFFNKSDCQVTDRFTWSSTMRLDDHFDVWKSPSDLLIDDVVEISWLLNGSVIERYFYAAGLGLVKWIANDGRESFITAFDPGEDNVRERIDCYDN